MTPLQAFNELIAGRFERYCEPGRFRVYWEDGKAKVELFSGQESAAPVEESGLRLSPPDKA